VYRTWSISSSFRQLISAQVPSNTCLTARTSKEQLLYE
jgi:hypothetical protein